MSRDAPIVMESSYSNGILEWGAGAYTVKDEDIITVVEDGGSSGGYKILSLQVVEENQPFELRETPASILPKDFLDQWLSQGLPSYLQEGNEVTILVSTRSGTGLALTFLEVLLQPVLDAIGLPESRRTVIHTRSAQSLKEFVAGTLQPAANGGNKQTVLMLSGDGGIVDSINPLSEIKRSEYDSPPPVPVSKLIIEKVIHKSSCRFISTRNGQRSLPLTPQAVAKSINLRPEPANTPEWQTSITSYIPSQVLAWLETPHERRSRCQSIASRFSLRCCCCQLWTPFHFGSRFGHDGIPETRGQEIWNCGQQSTLS